MVICTLSTQLVLQLNCNSQRSDKPSLQQEELKTGIATSAWANMQHVNKYAAWRKSRDCLPDKLFKIQDLMFVLGQECHPNWWKYKV